MKENTAQGVWPWAWREQTIASGWAYLHDERVKTTGVVAPVTSKLKLSVQDVATSVKELKQKVDELSGAVEIINGQPKYNKKPATGTAAQRLLQKVIDAD
jgi:hypothetical protein